MSCVIFAMIESSQEIDNLYGDKVRERFATNAWQRVVRLKESRIFRLLLNERIGR